ncbi:uncharacterized protein [Pocillopora verrucosa]|uniref:uncharacterized protein n=1 Tax=Pocillopora verrucosa TaxID=203993 RepID=UPI0033420153
MEKLMESFDRENNITPSLPRDTYSHDHTYLLGPLQSTAVHECLLPTCLSPAQSVHRSALVRLHKLCAFLEKQTWQCEVSCYTCVEESVMVKVEFDGSELTLFNMSSYIVSYEVLRDFMFHFLKGRYNLRI